MGNLQFLRKAKIDDFVGAIVRHDVFGLEIAVHDFEAVQLHESIDDMLEYNPSLVFRYSGFPLDLSLKSLAIAILNHHDLQIFVFEDIVALKQVRTVAHVHEARLAFGQPKLDGLDYLIGLVSDLLHVNEFDCYLPFGLVVHALEHRPV